MAWMVHQSAISAVRPSRIPITVNTAGSLHNEFNGNGWNMDLYYSTDGFDHNYYGAAMNGLTAASGGAISVL